MNNKKDAVYKFNENILKLSLNANIDNAKLEWEKILEDKNDGLCICQHKIKNIIYMYNILTKKTIMVGSRCYKKFNFNNTTIKSKILKDILKKNLLAGGISNN
uniref:Uncharacterized protein n=1 Tax=viral metagenome TaxID=1070528 RepID=A0A6C0EFJ4_9ZZZZ